MRVSLFPRPFFQAQLRVLLLCLGFLLLPFSKAQEEPPFDSPNPLSGSALAPERPLRFDFPQEVEALLRALGEASCPVEKFSLRVTWKLTCSEPYDWSRDGVGPRSFKCSLDWIRPEEGGELSSEGEAFLGGKGGDFHIFRRNESGEVTQWWHKKGSYFYSSRMQELLPFVTRYPSQYALESGMAAYGEGLCLLLLRFMPGEFLRRSENLKLGELLRVNGDLYQALVATPGWIKDPPTLPNRNYFPYNQSKLLSWARFTPTVTYFVNPEAMRIEGVVFTFYTFDRSHRGRWTVLPRETGERFEAWVTRWSPSPLGDVPGAMRGVYVREGKTVREIQMEVTLESGDFFEELSLPAGRRQYEPWPPFGSEVYRSRISSGENDYANRVRLIDALAFEGKFEEALGELKSFLSDIRADSGLAAESLGGIDWHLGFALYEILQNPQAPENRALWTDFEPAEPYIGILGRALDFFARWHRAEHSGLVEEYFRLYRERFGLKARIMHAAQRRLTERVETETDRALELEQLMRRAETDKLKLQALTACVEAFLREKNYQGALQAIELAGVLISDPRIRADYQHLRESWEERIQAALSEREERWIRSLIRAREDLLSQLSSRLLRERALNRAGVVERLEVLIEQTQGELKSLESEGGR